MKWIFFVAFVIVSHASYISDVKLESDGEKFDISAGNAPVDEMENYKDYVENYGILWRKKLKFF